MTTAIAKLLEIQFEGYFMCRLATDPDPTNEERGVSGYTMALMHEDPLDQVIRTQIEDKKFLKRNLREPAQRMKIRIGVDVNDVLFDGKPLYGPTRDALLGAKVYLEGKDEPFQGPIFDSRNNIVGSDDNMAFVVNPFELAIRSRKRTGLAFEAKDWLDPSHPKRKIWQIEDPTTYARRLPSFAQGSTAAQAAIRVFDWNAYFADRVKFLRQRIAELEKEKKGKGKAEVEALETRIQAMQSRIFMIDFWGDRFHTKLGFQVTYSFNVNGPQKVHDPKNLLRGKVAEGQPWPVTFWMGSWDGDLLVGWMQGSLSVPFQPEGRAGS
jgi:hypothetical protein